MREKGATERPQAFRYERAPDRYARMPCQYVRLPFHVERTSFRIERMSFHRGRIRGSFQFARDSFQINAISVPLCAISLDYSRSNICNARSIFREKAFHFHAHAQCPTAPIRLSTTLGRASNASNSQNGTVVPGSTFWLLLQRNAGFNYEGGA